jgi:hypothetical protein
MEPCAACPNACIRRGECQFALIRPARAPRPRPGRRGLTGWHQSAMGAFNALSSNLPWHGAKLFRDSAWVPSGSRGKQGASGREGDPRRWPKERWRRCITTPHSRNNVEKSVVIARDTNTIPSRGALRRAMKPLRMPPRLTRLPPLVAAPPRLTLSPGLVGESPKCAEVFDDVVGVGRRAMTRTHLANDALLLVGVRLEARRRTEGATLSLRWLSSFTRDGHDPGQYLADWPILPTSAGSRASISILMP